MEEEEEEEVVTRLMHLQPGASLVTPALPRGAKLDNADYKREKNFEKRREMECRGSADEMVEHLEREDG